MKNESKTSKQNDFAELTQLEISIPLLAVRQKSLLKIAAKVNLFFLLFFFLYLIKEISSLDHSTLENKSLRFRNSCSSHTSILNFKFHDFLPRKVSI